MKKLISLFILVTSYISLGQNIQVDSQTYTPQQLIEDILIDSNCIEGVVVTNVIGGNFNTSDQSYGYFNANGSTFPFSRGVVLSTGRLQNVPGPNTSLSDDDATDWFGDLDLEQILNESNTYNATIIEFEFIAVADKISFRYIFASEEYQENNTNTCEYSDLFGFLIRPQNETQYTNIALVPNTNTPVKVTTVHPGIPGGCDAINETYFGSWNSSTAPINFNGQTAILTATADVIPNEVYHVKLVIADEQNYRYDSAVFLEAGSFRLTTDLGPARLLSTNNPICENEQYQLDATEANAQTYKWFKDGLELSSEINSILNITDSGTYNVEVTLDNNCISYGEVVLEFSSNPVVFDTTLNTCDINQDQLTVYNLLNATQEITNNDSTIQITGFFSSEINAEQINNPISNPDYFENTLANQTIYARVENTYGCYAIAEIELQATYNALSLDSFIVCDDDMFDGITEFNLNNLRLEIANSVPDGAVISFYVNIDDVYTENPITTSSYENITPYNQELFVKITVNNQCYAITTVALQVLNRPLLEDDITNENSILYCLNTYPETITLHAGIVNDTPTNYSYTWSNGENTSSIDINEVGNYSVIVTAANGCTSTRFILVEASNTATIVDVIIEELSDNNTITVMASGEGDYEYALDNGGFQDNSDFNYVSAGFHIVKVRDKKGCGITVQEVAIFGFPKFFTPNGDTINDIWELKGVNAFTNQDIIVSIFNRYGKLLKSISYNTGGWDGTL
ncbi:MAG: choice-of-anchor L domain-containing protein, partial [Bacteroidia bacterium]|nr:choice-of-anchor L domain-containing protein [Bacteroidia bacterium]